MHLVSRIHFIALSALGLIACGGGGGGGGSGGNASGTGGSGGGGPPVDLPCDVDAVLQNNCRSCHSDPPKYGAPMPLVTHAHLTAPSVFDAAYRVYERVGARTHDDEHPMPQPPNPRLNTADQATLDTWIAAGAPKNEDGCGGTGGSGGGSSGVSCTPDVTLEPASPWVMPKDVEDVYVCYGVDVPVSSKRHITAMVPRIDNSALVHHILLFEADSSVSPTPTECEMGSGDKRIIAAWAPGGGALELPPEAGFPMDGTAHFMMQIHYSNLTHLDGQKDSTGYSFCTTDKLRPNDADVLAFGTVDFTIPAHDSLDTTCDFTTPMGVKNLHVIGATPHMHKLGKHISTVLLPGGDGAPKDLGTRDAWDFQNQYYSEFDVTINAGDVVRTRCVYENPGNVDVKWGEKTNDEMCWSFTTYYPKLQVSGFNWTIPSLMSKCSPTK